MNVPAWLKPENSPVAPAFSTWLDFAPSGVASRFFLLWFIILYAAFHVLSGASLGLYPQTLQTFVWSMHPAAGYDGAPPLAALMAAGWFAIFPVNDWAFHMLAIFNAAVGLFTAELIARRYMQGDKRLFVLLLLLLTPFYQFFSDRFGPDQTMLSTWPLATYFFLRAFDTRALKWSVAAGVFAGLAILGKHHSLFLIAGFVAAWLASPERWSYFKSPSPWLCALVGALVIAPHVKWLYAAGQLPIVNDGSSAAGAGPWFGDLMASAATSLGTGIACVAALLVVYWLAVRPSRGTLQDTVRPADPAGRMLVVIFAVALLLPIVVAPFIGLELAPLATTPAWFLLPIVLLRPDSARLTRVGALRMTTLVVAITLVALVASPWLAIYAHERGTSEGREYFRAIGAEVTQAWRLAMVSPLAIVMGDRDLVNAVAFYSPDHPDAVPDFDLARAPWVTPERLRRSGFATVCRADTSCADTARREAGTSDFQVITYATTSPYRGKPGKLGRFIFLLVSPQRPQQVRPPQVFPPPVFPPPAPPSQVTPPQSAPSPQIPSSPQPPPAEAPPPQSSSPEVPPQR